MESKKNLVLLGMMASGKSTIGNLVSKKLGLKFYDTDKIIEKEMNMTISQIFTAKSEIFFRSLEETFIAFAASGALSASRHIIEAHASGDATEYIAYSSILK